MIEPNRVREAAEKQEEENWMFRTFLKMCADEKELDKQVREQVEIQIKYAGYIERQTREVRRQQYYENLRLPANMDYSEVNALSIEVRQKLDKQKPETLGQASRISGVTPAAISLLLIYLKKQGLVDFAETHE